MSCFYNREDFVKRTLSSVISQSFKDFEAIFIDDGSKDKTREELLSFQSEQIRIISHENMGFTRSISKAISMANGEYIAILGSGDEALEERLAIQSEFLDRNPNVAVVGGRYFLIFTNEKKELSPYYGETDLYSILLDRSIYGHSEVMFRKSAYDAAGGYRSFFKYSQDNDLWLRMSQFGKLAQVPDIIQNIYKLSDGVTVDPVKSMMSKYYRDFAVHCANERNSGKKDPIDIYGSDAALLRPKSVKLRKRFIRSSIKSFARQKYDESFMLIEAAKREGGAPIPSIIHFLISLQSVRKISSFVFNTIKNR